MSGITYLISLAFNGLQNDRHLHYPSVRECIYTTFGIFSAVENIYNYSWANFIQEVVLTFLNFAFTY